MLKLTAKAPNKIKASLTINNRLRVDLSLTMEEYAIANVIFERRKAKLPVNRAILYHETGIGDDESTFIIRQLKMKGILEERMDNGVLKSFTTNAWNQYFDIEKEFDNEDEDKLGFWQIFRKHGNKATALGVYKKARKIADEETLKEAAVRYIASKEGEELKHILHASTWLNPEKKHWEDVIQTGKLELTDEQTFKGTFGKK